MPRPAVATISRSTSTTPPPNVLICAARDRALDLALEQRTRLVGPHVATRTEDLEEDPVHPDLRLDTEHLHRRRVRRRERAVRHRRRHAPVQEPQRLELRVRVGELRLHPRHVDHLLAGVRAAGVRLAAPRLGVVVEAEREAGERGEADTLVVELVGDEPPAGVDVADDVAHRHADVVVVRGLGDDAADRHDRRRLEARRRRRDDDHRDALVLRGVGSVRQASQM